MRRILCFAVLALSSVTVWSQVLQPQIAPIPIPGGDIFSPPAGPVTQINQFFPGVGAGFDGLDAEPHGITNFEGTVAIGYTNGAATDNAGNTYQVITDIRVYQGDYVGSQATYGAGGSTTICCVRVRSYSSRRVPTAE